MSDLPSFTEMDVAAHSKRDDLWVIIHGKVYDVTKYVRDHPGGADVLIDVAGKNASAEYDEVGHSEDADEILTEYLIGIASDFTAKRSTAVKLVQQIAPPVVVNGVKSTSSSSRAIKIIASVLALSTSAFCVSTYAPSTQRFLLGLSVSDLLRPSIKHSLPDRPSQFVSGFAIASVLSSIAAAIVGKELSKFTHIESGFGKYPPRRKAIQTAKPTNLHLVKGFLDSKEFKGLKVARIDQLSSNVNRYIFKLPGSRDIVGIPIGQHVAIKAIVDGKTVQRSYTPTSNNLDRGVLELVIKIYGDGQLTGRYFANLKVGDQVLFRGPKGAMRYQAGHCKKIGMIAGGTGITPMYQLIRAICEDERDTTEVSLILANRSEDDILLREELDSFARRYPKNLKVWYMLDKAPPKWAYGSGFVTADLMKEKLSSPGQDTKIMLCGPPGMINASKKALVGLGFKAPGAIAKISDEIFCF